VLLLLPGGTCGIAVDRRLSRPTQKRVFKIFMSKEKKIYQALLFLVTAQVSLWLAFKNVSFCLS
jgi:hypothetical protein